MGLQVFRPLGLRPDAAGAHGFKQPCGLQVDDLLELFLAGRQLCLGVFGLRGVVVLARLGQGLDRFAFGVAQLGLHGHVQHHGEGAVAIGQRQRASVVQPGGGDGAVGQLLLRPAVAIGNLLHQRAGLGLHRGRAVAARQAQQQLDDQGIIARRSAFEHGFDLRTALVVVAHVVLQQRHQLVSRRVGGQGQDALFANRAAQVLAHLLALAFLKHLLLRLGVVGLVVLAVFGLGVLVAALVALVAPSGVLVGVGNAFFQRRVARVLRDELAQHRAAQRLAACAVQQPHVAGKQGIAPGLFELAGQHHPPAGDLGLHRAAIGPAGGGQALHCKPGQPCGGLGFEAFFGLGQQQRRGQAGRDVFAQRFQRRQKGGAHGFTAFLVQRLGQGGHCGGVLQVGQPAGGFDAHLALGVGQGVDHAAANVGHGSQGLLCQGAVGLALAQGQLHQARHPARRDVRKHGQHAHRGPHLQRPVVAFALGRRHQAQAFVDELGVLGKEGPNLFGRQHIHGVRGVPVVAQRSAGHVLQRQACTLEHRCQGTQVHTACGLLAQPFLEPIVRPKAAPVVRGREPAHQVHRAKAGQGIQAVASAHHVGHFAVAHALRIFLVAFAVQQFQGRLQIVGAHLAQLGVVLLAPGVLVLGVLVALDLFFCSLAGALHHFLAVGLKQLQCRIAQGRIGKGRPLGRGGQGLVLRIAGRTQAVQGGTNGLLHGLAGFALQRCLQQGRGGVGGPAGQQLGRLRALGGFTFAQQGAQQAQAVFGGNAFEVFDGLGARGLGAVHRQGHQLGGKSRGQVLGLPDALCQLHLAAGRQLLQQGPHGLGVVSHVLGHLGGLHQSAKAVRVVAVEPLALKHQLQHQGFVQPLMRQQLGEQGHAPGAPLGQVVLVAVPTKGGMQRVVDEVLQPIGNGRAGVVQRLALVARRQHLAQPHDHLQWHRVLGHAVVKRGAARHAFVARTLRLAAMPGMETPAQAAGLAQQIAADLGRGDGSQVLQHAFFSALGDECQRALCHTGGREGAQRLHGLAQQVHLAGSQCTRIAGGRSQHGFHHLVEQSHGHPL